MPIVKSFIDNLQILKSINDISVRMFYIYLSVKTLCNYSFISINPFC